MIVCSYGVIDTYGRGGFVQDEQLAPSDHGTCQREHLSLADRKVRAATCDLGVERDAKLIVCVLDIEKTRRAKGSVEGRVVVLAKGI